MWGVCVDGCGWVWVGVYVLHNVVRTYVRICTYVCTIFTIHCVHSQPVCLCPLACVGGLRRALHLHLCQEGDLHCGLSLVGEEGDSDVKETEVTGFLS